jgi:hypothetical protein
LAEGLLKEVREAMFLPPIQHSDGAVGACSIDLRHEMRWCDVTKYAVEWIGFGRRLSVALKRTMAAGG